MEQHEEMLSPEEQYAQLAPTLDTDGFSLYAAAEEITGLKVYEEFPYEDNHGMFEMADGHTLLRYLEAAYFGTVTWEIVPGTPYERAILGEVDKTTPEYRTFYQKICAGAAAHIKKRIGKERQNVKEPISEINKESFWDLIRDAKIACGQDMDAMLAYLKDRLVSMGPTQAQNFHDIIHAYIRLIEDTKKWVLSPERKAPKKERDYAAARLDGVITKIKNAMQHALAKIQRTLMQPEVKQAGKEQIKKKAKESIMDKLAKAKINTARENRERWEREGRIASTKKQDMEL